MAQDRTIPKTSRETNGVACEDERSTGELGASRKDGSDRDEDCDLPEASSNLNKDGY